MPIREIKIWPVYCLILLLILVACKPESKEGDSSGTAKQYDENQQALVGLYDQPIESAYPAYLQYLKQVPAIHLPEVYQVALMEAETNQKALPHLVLVPILIRWSELDSGSFQDHFVQHTTWLHSKISQAGVVFQLLYESFPVSTFHFIESLPLESREIAINIMRSIVANDAHGQEQLMGLMDQPDSHIDSDPTVENIRALVQTDPSQAIIAIKALVHDQDSIEQLISLLPDLAKDAPTRIGELALQLANIHQQSLSLRTLGSAIGPWFKTTPETAHKAVAEMKSFSAQHEFWKAGYLAMAEDDPALATKMAFETITATGIRKRIMPSLIAEWVKIDPQAAMQFVMNGPTHMLSMYSTAFEAWVKQAPEFALDNLNQLSRTRPNLLSSDTTTHRKLIAHWIQSDKYNAINWIKGLPPGRLQDHYLVGAIQTLDIQNDYEILELSAKIQSDLFRNDALKSVVNKIKHQPNGTSQALTWLKALPETIDTARLQASLVADLVKTDVNAALAVFPEDGNRAEKIQFVNELSVSFYQQNAEASINWLEGLPGYLAREGLYQIGKELLWEEGPIAAKDFLEQNAQPSLKYNLYSFIAADWCKVDPAATLQWVNNIVSDQDRNGALYRLTQEMLRVEPSHIHEWLERPDVIEKNKQKIIESTSSYYGYESRDSLTGLLWATKIKDKSDRLKQITEVTKWVNDAERQQLKYAVVAHPDLAPSDRDIILSKL